MDNLTIAHLAPYLPYGLKYMNVKNNEITTMKALDSDVEMVDWGWGCALEFHELKPILRPLSDLTKEIEHNGEKFVPTKEYHYLRFEEISTFKGGENHLIFMQVREYQILLELHFDVFGLIEKGLAIDIKEATNE
jgi:hypothetical protein